MHLIKLYNIGNNNPVELLYFINVIEEALGKKAKKNMMPMQPGDVPATYADIDDLMQVVGFTPKPPLKWESGGLLIGIRVIIKLKKITSREFKNEST